MLTGMIMGYVAGLMGTTFFVFKDRSLPQSHLWNAGVVLMWPVYWTYFLVFMFLNRQGGR